jgi:hypothetical protein
MKSHWQRIKTALRLSAAAVAIGAGVAMIGVAWIEGRASDAALLYSDWNFSEQHSARELRDMFFAGAIVGVVWAVWGFIKIRDWVLASPKVKRALSLSALLGWSLAGGVFAYVGVVGLFDPRSHDSAGTGAVCLGFGAVIIGAAVLEMRRWRRVGRVA